MARQDFTDSDPRLAWAAGLFEGEGCISYSPAKDRWQLVVEMTDRDVLETFHEVVGVGTIIPKKRKGGHKPTWRWACGATSDTIMVLGLLLPWLHGRRSERASEALTSLRARRIGRDRNWELEGACRKGIHDVSRPEGVLVDREGYRRCRECRRTTQRRHYVESRGN